MEMLQLSLPKRHMSAVVLGSSLGVMCPCSTICPHGKCESLTVSYDFASQSQPSKSVTREHIRSSSTVIEPI